MHQDRVPVRIGLGDGGDPSVRRPPPVLDHERLTQLF